MSRNGWQKTTRMTKQKKVILDILRSTKVHPSADWIYEQARRILPDISLGTVYRNLRLLREKGEILELSYSRDFSRYDGNPQNHYHFMCRKCGRVMDVDLPLMNELEEKVARLIGGKVETHRLEFYGLCQDCCQE
ncbi:MAG: Fur family transcriptional regulator, peroxide stress response regulator [Eubacteriales bacterium]|nr:Fur family transcriptional regulator, peroxide stress response regulator [Eubacteriales bacterium]MDN5363370.1 Fur family transcriptional regulator, peroxide stress response regulator [Eubacteriales bacterium]